MIHNSMISCCIAVCFWPIVEKISYSQIHYMMLVGFCRCQNGKHGVRGADVLRLVETEQEVEQDHAQMDRVALASMKIRKFAM